jgi:hypothetical protein
MKNILLLDTETTGTDERAVCIEVAVSLYSVEYAAVVRSYSSLIRHDANEAEHVNKIHVELLTEAPDAATVWRGVERFGQCAEAVVCHGVEFDRRMVPASILSTVPWICSMDGGIWPHGSAKRESLVSLALSAGLGISSAHRAAADPCGQMPPSMLQIHGTVLKIDAGTMRRSNSTPWQTTASAHCPNRSTPRHTVAASGASVSNSTWILLTCSASFASCRISDEYDRTTAAYSTL